MRQTKDNVFFSVSVPTKTVALLQRGAEKQGIPFKTLFKNIIKDFAVLISDELLFERPAKDLATTDRYLLEQSAEHFEKRALAIREYLWGDQKS